MLCAKMPTQNKKKHGTDMINDLEFCVRKKLLPLFMQKSRSIFFLLYRHLFTHESSWEAENYFWKNSSFSLQTLIIHDHVLHVTLSSVERQPSPSMPARCRAQSFIFRLEIHSRTITGWQRRRANKQLISIYN